MKEENQSEEAIQPNYIPFYSTQQIAKILNVSDRQVRNMILAKKITAIMIGGIWRVRPQDLDAYIAGEEKKTKKHLREYRKRPVSIQELKKTHKDSHPRG